MCGIAGVLGPTVDPGAAEVPIETLKHRGPNGVRLEDGPGWSVGHARLSIIDLEGGWQPLHAAGSAVIGNGEIYNYVELAADNQLKGSLATGSDFEPLLHLYARMGSEAFEKLRGMFGFCLIGVDGCRWLVRDGFGIKPLYYRCEPERLTFASEPRALIAAGASRTIEPERAEEVLALGYTIGEQTIFKDVKRLAPGGSLCLREGEVSPTAGSFDQAWLTAEPRTFASDEDAVEALDRVLEDSVRVHQRSDVPYGLFLSGGIDSAAIAVLMARLNTRPVIAYTCGFDAEGARDERAQAERVARSLNLDWRETTFGEADFWRILPDVVWALDEPTADYATLPTYKLAEAAKSELTVILTGEGGDELFAGYGRYRRGLRAKWLGGRRPEPQVDAPYLKDKGEGALGRWRAEADHWGAYGATDLQSAQIADLKTWLHADLLLKLDRCLMAHGLEGRTPFLDNEVAAFALHLPDRLKLRGRYGKWLLRKWLEGRCPAAEPWAKKKGFTVPVQAWIAPRAADLGARVAGIEGIVQVCDPDRVLAVFGEQGPPAARWPLLFYALWWLVHVAGEEPKAALKALGVS